MDSHFTITYLESGKPFASIIASSDKMEIAGSSKEGIEWARWAILKFPNTDKDSIDKVLLGVGPHLKIDGPHSLTKAIREKFDALLSRSGLKATEDKIIRDETAAPSAYR